MWEHQNSWHPHYLPFLLKKESLMQSLIRTSILDIGTQLSFLAFLTRRDFWLKGQTGQCSEFSHVVRVCFSGFVYCEFTCLEMALGILLGSIAAVLPVSCRRLMTQQWVITCIIPLPLGPNSAFLRTVLSCEVRKSVCGDDTDWAIQALLRETWFLDIIAFGFLL